MSRAADTRMKQLTVFLTDEEIDALKIAREHVRVHMAHDHSWKMRDTAMVALSEVLAAAQSVARR